MTSRDDTRGLRGDEDGEKRSRKKASEKWLACAYGYNATAMLYSGGKKGRQFTSVAIRSSLECIREAPGREAFPIELRASPVLKRPSRSHLSKRNVARTRQTRKSGCAETALLHLLVAVFISSTVLERHLIGAHLAWLVHSTRLRTASDPLSHVSRETSFPVITCNYGQANKAVM